MEYRLFLCTIAYFIVFNVIRCECNNYFENYYEDNILEHFVDRNAIKYENFKWPNGIIPFVFDNSCDTTDRKNIVEAMLLIQQNTCIRFRPKEPDTVTYIKYVKTNACGAGVGYRKNQTKPIIVMYTPHCLSLLGAVQHEILHIIGLFHEQARPDRDEYITILWDNIIDSRKNNFEKGTFEYLDTFDLPYDYQSLMHYPNDAFSKRKGLNTIVAKNGSAITLGQTEGPSFLDYEKVRRMYNCGRK